MSYPLEYVITNHSNQSVSIKLTGFIDEATREILFRLRGEIPEGIKSLTLETSGISRISSIGIAHYSAFIKGFKGIPITYRACSVVFMDFLSMLPGIKEDAEIVSFYGSFFCGRCDDEFSLLIDTKDIAQSRTAICPRCAETATATGYLEEQIDGN